MKAQVISFNCTLRNRLGRVLSSTYNQDVLTGIWPDSALLKGLAEGLNDLKSGERRKISLTAEHAYGFYDPKLVMKLSSRSLVEPGAQIHLGDRVEKRSVSGEMRLFLVTKIEGGSVTLDANHPLAGQDLVFDIEATDVRDATSDDMYDTELATRDRLLH